MLRAFRYRFYPSVSQASILRRTFGCVRLVYNRALRERSEAWTTAKKSVSYAAQDRGLTVLKTDPEFAFLREVSCVPLQQSLRHLQRAYANFFAKRAAYPSFKRKRSGGSATYTRNAFRWDGAAVTLAKMDAPLDIRWSRPLPKDAKPSSVTVSLDPAGRWHVSILCDDPTVNPLKKRRTAVGIDVGLNTLVTLSTGEKIANPRHDARELDRKRRLSRALSRKIRGSRNWHKTRMKLARLHARVTDRRRDHLHKLSTRLVRENQAIVVEDLAVRNLVRNRSLSRAISDAGWSEFVGMLAYKCAWYGRDLVTVDRFFPSSKTCGVCGTIRERLRLDEREWTCAACGTTHDRDVNAARNILAAGHAERQNACGDGISHRVLRDSVRLSVKQESAGLEIRQSVKRAAPLPRTRSRRCSARWPRP